MDQFAESMRALCAGLVDEFREEINELKQSSTTTLKGLETLQKEHVDTQFAMEASAKEWQTKSEAQDQARLKMHDKLAELAAEVKALKSENAVVAKKCDDLAAKMNASVSANQRVQIHTSPSVNGAQYHDALEAPIEADTTPVPSPVRNLSLIGSPRFHRESSPASTITFGRPTPQIQRHYMHSPFHPELSTIFSSAASNALPRTSPAPVSMSNDFGIAESLRQGGRKRSAATSVLPNVEEESTALFLEPQLPLRTSKRRKGQVSEEVTVTAAPLESTPAPDLSTSLEDAVENEGQALSDDSDNIVVKHWAKPHSTSGSASLLSLLRNAENYRNGDDPDAQAALEHSNGMELDQDNNVGEDSGNETTNTTQNSINKGTNGDAHDNDMAGTVADLTPRSKLLSNFHPRTSTMQAPKPAVLQPLDENIVFGRVKGQRTFRSNPKQNPALKDFVPLEQIDGKWGRR